MLAQLLKLNATAYQGLPTDTVGKMSYAKERFEVDLKKHFEDEEKILFFKSTFDLPESNFSLSADVHHFMSNQKASDGKNTFGQEIDLTIVYKFVKGTNITWGGSLFFPGDLMKTNYSPREDISFWSYLMITANL